MSWSLAWRGLAVPILLVALAAPALARVDDPGMKLGPDVAKNLALGLEHLGPPAVEVEVWPRLPAGDVTGFAKARFAARHLPERSALLVLGIDDKSLGIALGPAYAKAGVSQDLAGTLAARAYAPELAENRPAEGALALATQLHLALRLGRDPLAKDAAVVSLGQDGTPWWVWACLGLLASGGLGYGLNVWRKASKRARRKQRLGGILERVDVLEAVGRRAEPMLAAAHPQPDASWRELWEAAQAEHQAVAEAAVAVRKFLRKGAWDAAEKALAEAEPRLLGAEAQATALAAAIHKPFPLAFLQQAGEALKAYGRAEALDGRGGSEGRLATARRLLLQSPPDPEGALELLAAHEALSRPASGASGGSRS